MRMEELPEMFQFCLRDQRCVMTVQGLWAELFVIQRARDPSVLLRCWHTAPEDRFDFAEDSQRLEVKTASGRVRMHRFSQEQLRPPGGTLAMVASVLMERSAGGQCVNDLIDDLRQRVTDPDLLLRLDAVVAQTLGNEWRTAQEDRFDRQLAVESLRFLDARTIPSVPSGLPPEVTEVPFRVDLTSHPLNLSDELERFAVGLRIAGRTALLSRPDGSGEPSYLLYATQLGTALIAAWWGNG
jgi:Putative  PD-(D/E)XK family member, (DUF4420)